MEKVYCNDCKHSNLAFTSYEGCYCTHETNIKGHFGNIIKLKKSVHILNANNDCKRFERKGWIRRLLAL